jgi:hypothetical protein
MQHRFLRLPALVRRTLCKNDEELTPLRGEVWEWVVHRPETARCPFRPATPVPT